MNKRLILPLLLASFWFFSVYLAVGAWLSWVWAYRCALVNLIIGMLALLLVTQDERRERLFYEGPKGDEDSSLLIAIMWGLPFAWWGFALVWWIIRLLLKLIA